MPDKNISINAIWSHPSLAYVDAVVALMVKAAAAASKERRSMCPIIVSSEASFSVF